MHRECGDAHERSDEDCAGVGTSLAAAVAAAAGRRVADRAGPLSMGLECSAAAATSAGPPRYIPANVRGSGISARLRPSLHSRCGSREQRALLQLSTRWIQKRAPEQLELTIEATRNSVLVLAAAQPQHRVRDRRALVCLTRLVEQRLRNMRDRNAAQIDETWLDSSRQAGPARRSVSSAVPAEAK
jgi:hypothetical protein